MKTSVPCCATCASTSIVKASYNGAGTQQYLCKACGAHRVLVAKSSATDRERKQLVIHRQKAMHSFRLSAEAEEHFVFEERPAHAADLNPLDTGVWHHLKNVALANVCCRDLQELREKLAAAIVALRRKPRLMHAAFANAKLSLG